MLNELRIIFESLTEYDKWSVVSGLAWKHAALMAQQRRGCSLEDMNFDPSDTEVNIQMVRNITLMIDWVIGDEATPNAKITGG